MTILEEIGPFGAGLGAKGPESPQVFVSSTIRDKTAPVPVPSNTPAPSHVVQGKTNPSHLSQTIPPNKLPTPVVVTKLEQYHSGHPKDKIDYLVNGFTHGFSLGFEGSQQGQHSTNLLSAQQRPDVVAQKLEKEVKLGPIAGPFQEKPFPNLHLNPLGLVPKKTGDF